MNLKPLGFAVCLVSLMSVHAFGWSAPGHRIVAQLAMRELTREAATDPKAAKTRTAILKILKDNNTTLDAVAVWADQVRRSSDYGYADDWHFINIPRSATKYDATTLCKTSASAPEGNCAIGGIEHFRKVLINPTSNAAARFDAFRFIVHFVGDVHQPLHTSEDSDAGGNGKAVCFLGRGRKSCMEVFDGKPEKKNLHATWDKYMIEHSDPDEHAYTAGLDKRIATLTAAQRADLQKGTPVEWAEESHAIARTFAYNLMKLKESHVSHAKAYDDFYYVNTAYEKDNIRRIDDQLIKGGLRLAAYLKQLF